MKKKRLTDIFAVLAIICLCAMVLFIIMAFITFNGDFLVLAYASAAIMTMFAVVTANNKDQL